MTTCRLTKDNIQLVGHDLRHFVYALICLWMRCRRQIFLRCTYCSIYSIIFLFYHRNSSNYAHVKY